MGRWPISSPSHETAPAHNVWFVLYTVRRCRRREYDAYRHQSVGSRFDLAYHLVLSALLRLLRQRACLAQREYIVGRFFFTMLPFAVFANSHYVSTACRSTPLATMVFGSVHN